VSEIGEVKAKAGGSGSGNEGLETLSTKVKVEYKQGATPHLLLTAADGDETKVTVADFSVDDLVSFLKESLQV
jgi:hypothetical protein